MLLQHGHPANHRRPLLQRLHGLEDCGRQISPPQQLLGFVPDPCKKQQKIQLRDTHRSANPCSEAYPLSHELEQHQEGEAYTYLPSLRTWRPLLVLL